MTRDSLKYEMGQVFDSIRVLTVQISSQELELSVKEKLLVGAAEVLADRKEDIWNVAKQDVVNLPTYALAQKMLEDAKKVFDNTRISVITLKSTISAMKSKLSVYQKAYDRMSRSLETEATVLRFTQNG